MSADEPSGTPARAAILALVIAICLLGTALRLYELDADSLWGDEILMVMTSQLDIRSVPDFQVEHSVHPPLLYIVTHYFLLLFGDSDFAVRFPPALFGALSILLAYKVGEILWSRREGVIGAFLLAVSAHHVQYSQEARHYALMVFLALLLLVFLLKALQSNKKSLWIGFIFSTSLSLYNHYFAFLLLPAVVIFAGWVVAQNWISYRKRGPAVTRMQAPYSLSPAARKGLMFSTSLVLVGASYLPWLHALQAMISRQVGSDAVGASPASVQRSLSFLRMVATDYSGAHGAALLLALALFVLGLAASRWKRSALVLLWMATPFSFLTVVTPPHFLRSKYVLFILPLYLLVIASGITFATKFLGRRLNRIEREVRWGLVFTSSVVMLFGVVSIASLRDYYHSEKEDWRSAVAYLLQNMAQGDVVITDGEAYQQGADARRPLRPLAHYSSLYGDDLTAFRARRNLVDRVQGVGRPGASTWGVLWHVRDLANLERVRGDIQVVEFYRVGLVRLLDPAGDVLQDTTSVLETLALVQPLAEGRFDLHLALAQIYLRTGRFEKAGLELDKANQVQPDAPRASHDLALTRAELEQVSYARGSDVRQPLWRSIGLQIALLGYDLYPTSLTAVNSLDVNLWWQALAKMDRDYSVFIHVVDADGRIWGQSDSVLERGAHRTSEWAVGEVVTAQYEVELAQDTPPGDYIVKAGVYHWETGERLPVWDDNGQRVAEDAIPLGSIRLNMQGTAEGMDP